jgi:hypothetical protein
VGSQWYWIPDSVNTTPVYSPALVAFVPSQSDYIGWVPLGPGDPYAPRYYDTNWQSHYLYGAPVIQQQVVNYYVPNAVTLVPLQQFGNEIDYRSVRKFDKQMLAGTHPVYDALSVGPLRNAFIHSAWGRGKIDLPPGIAKRFVDRSVVISGIPVSPVVHKDLTKSLRVEALPEKARGQNFKVKDERQSFRSIGRTVQVAEADRRSERAAQQESQRLERQQQQQSRKQNAEIQREQQRQVREQQQAQRESVRKQQVENARRENEARRVANQQAASQRSQQVKQQRERQNQRPAAAAQKQRQVLMPIRQPERPQQSQKLERRESKLGPPQPQQVQQQAPQRQPQATQKAERSQGPPAREAGSNPGKGKGKGKP